MAQAVLHREYMRYIDGPAAVHLAGHTLHSFDPRSVSIRTFPPLPTLFYDDSMDFLRLRLSRCSRRITAVIHRVPYSGSRSITFPISSINHVASHFVVRFAFLSRVTDIRPVVAEYGADLPDAYPNPCLGQVGLVGAGFGLL
jgi:hypothetical protein